MDALQTCRNAGAVREMLMSLPADLDETYNRILLKIKQTDAKYAIKILQWLAFAARPVMLEEVAEAVAMNIDSGCPDHRLGDPLEILDICTSLVTLSSSADEPANKLKGKFKNDISNHI